MPSHASSAWERLGEMLVRRRVTLDPRYRNRRVFVNERAPKLYRIINDAELGRRSNFEPGTIAALEKAYDLEPGSVQRVLDGGELEPGASSGAAPVHLLRPVTPAAADAGESGELAIFLPLVQRRLSDLTEAGDPRPSGTVMFDPATDPLGAGAEAAYLADAWDIAMDTPEGPDTAAVLTARLWVRLREYRAREAARRRGQSGALVLT